MGLIHRAFSVVVVLLFMSACGQKGPLVLPQKVHNKEVLPKKVLSKNTHPSHLEPVASVRE